MRPNKILARMREGRPATGCQLAFPSAALIDLMGLAGLDFVILDGEHGTFSWESLEDMCRSADLAGVTTIARVPNIEESTILRYLDRGVQGILGPGIDTGEQAQQLRRRVLLRAARPARARRCAARRRLRQPGRP